MTLRTLPAWLVIAGVVSQVWLAPPAGAQAPAGARASSNEQNRVLVRRWIEDGFNKHDPSVADALFAEQLSVNGHPVGRDGVKASMRRHLQGFPDLHVAIDEMIAEGDKVSLWYTVEGTHKGEFDGVAATGKRVTWIGSDLFRIENGRIAEARFLSDPLGLHKQLEVSVGR